MPSASGGRHMTPGSHSSHFPKSQSGVLRSMLIGPDNIWCIYFPTSHKTLPLYGSKPDMGLTRSIFVQLSPSEYMYDGMTGHRGSCKVASFSRQVVAQPLARPNTTEPSKEPCSISQRSPFGRVRVTRDT